MVFEKDVTNAAVVLLTSLLIVLGACQDTPVSAPGTDVSDVQANTDAPADTEGSKDTASPLDGSEVTGSEDAEDASDTVDGGDSDEADVPPSADTTPPEDTTPPVVTSCNDGIDNDGDGLVDWQHDLGCYGAEDQTEEALSRAEEAGWTTYDPSPDTQIVYVSSSDGDDATAVIGDPTQPFKTVAAGVAALRDGMPDWLLLKRGDHWEEALSDTKWQLQGPTPEAPMVIASYGDKTERPRLDTGVDYGFKIGPESHSNLSILGIYFRSHHRDPASPSFISHPGNPAFLRVGPGGDLLIEGCQFRYYRTLTLNTGSDPMPTNIAFRRNVVRDHYSPTDERSQGLYGTSVDGLLIEENIFDHNGWNKEIEGAHATKYNHNTYLSHVHNLVFRNNVYLRASSIGCKIRSDVTGGTTGITMEGNLVVEGEIGFALGGEGDAPKRFEDITIRDNVLLHIGRSNPTGRDFAWAVTVAAVDGADIRDNHILHNPWVTAIGIGIVGLGVENVTIEDNVVYDYNGGLLRFAADTGWGDISAKANILQSVNGGGAIIKHLGPIEAVFYASNQYYTPNSHWYHTDGGYLDYATWLGDTGELGSTDTQLSFTDPDRNLASYHESIGKEGTYEAFLEAVVLQRRHHWDPAYTAEAVNAYLRAGF
ncbi:MAG: hypothetical protein CMH54_04590 [Myxococcales bacterium]|nr:hypothetical protein [Myxococcales bacterium]